MVVNGGKSGPLRNSQ